MKFIKLILILFTVFHFSSLSASEDKLYNKIVKNLRCLVCQGQSVYDSDSEFANSLKFLVNQKINDGLNENQIYDYLKDKYGEWILYDPNFSKNTYFLWLLPLLMFFLGGAIIFKKLIKKN